MVTVSHCRDLGAPVVFACWQGNLQWWKQAVQGPESVKTVPCAEVDRFFQSHGDEFSPNAVYRAKTWGRFDAQYQRTFVDVGLMPLVESHIGKGLGDLIARTVSGLKSRLRRERLTPDWLLKSAFWLLAARILRDKMVPAFVDVDLSDVNDVFRRVARHYRTSALIPVGGSRRRDALIEAAATIAQFSNLAVTTTECLAYVYENTLISKETRLELGTHSTPSYLVDYVVGRLAPWIEEIPPEQRNVFEPACGHAAFLISAMRLLRDMLPQNISHFETQHEYLRQRLHGHEIDAFALEIARLSLTLADIPNPNGWDLRLGDMFEGEVLQRQAGTAMVLLANPPFEDFTPREKSAYRRRGVEPRYANKTAEVLGRTLPALPMGAVFGLVVPQTILSSKNAADLRQYLVRDFEVLEVCEFPDNIFKLSDMESAVVIGRKVGDRRQTGHTYNHRIVRRHDADRFRLDYCFSVTHRADQAQVSSENNWDLRVPERVDVWAFCEAMPRLSQFAIVGQGMFFRGAGSLPAGAVTVSKRRFAGAKKGFAVWYEGVRLDGQPREVWLNLDPSVVDRTVTGATTGIPQILLNYARVSRGPWRLKAVFDGEGHAVTSRFITVRPLSQAWSLECLWAVLNSPVANAFAYTHSGKRDNLVGMIRKLPVPDASAADVDRVTGAVSDYLQAVGKDDEGLKASTDAEVACRLLLRIDAEILRLYDFPPRLERQLLDLFAGWERQGVPFRFDRYYPDDYEPCFHLHDYLSDAYAASTAGYLRGRTEPKVPPELLRALDEAMKAFEE
ncbi:MAG: N-6 DNA methylase [Planctomycetia bacterium]|nr:N-6 DNA methylase [Planctomycetia bacterium]